MKSDSEARVREALRRYGLVVYKPPDDARNFKPADFLTWQGSPEGRVDPVTGYDFHFGEAISRWIEVKRVPPGAATWPTKDLRPAQLAGLSDAMRLGIDYWLLVHWPTAHNWTGVDLAEAQLDMTAWSAGQRLGPDHPLWRVKGTLSDVISVLL